MNYTLKNGKNIIIRKPEVDDAYDLINLIITADKETKFLTRNAGEFCISVEQEKLFIKNILENNDKEWFVVEYEGRIIGNCSVGLVGSSERLRHRAEVTFVILKDFCGMGIGGKLMQQCIKWCKSKNVTQIELAVVAGNERAINMYESFGFKTFGTIPNALLYKDNSYADEKFMVLKLQE